MRPIVTALIALIVSHVPRRDHEPAPQPEQPLHGTWSLVETADQHRCDRGDSQIRMRLEGNEVVLMFGEMITNRGAVVVGRGSDLKTVDFKFANGRTVVGIYEIERGMLTICADDAVRGRPADFTPQGKQWVEKWKVWSR